MSSVLVLIIIGSICRSIMENLSSEETSKIVYYIQYIVIATVVINSFLEILHLTENTIEKITNFMNLLVPLFTTLVLNNWKYCNNKYVPANITIYNKLYK